MRGGRGRSKDFWPDRLLQCSFLNLFTTGFPKIGHPEREPGRVVKLVYIQRAICLLIIFVDPQMFVGYDEIAGIIRRNRRVRIPSNIVTVSWSLFSLCPIHSARWRGVAIIGIKPIITTRIISEDGSVSRFLD